MPDRVRRLWEQLPKAVSKMRDDGVSLRQAAREFGIRPDTVVRLAGSAVRKLPNGRYVAAPRDRLLRVLVVPEPQGNREIALSDSREATKVSHYFTALRRRLHGTDPTALDRLRHKRIRTADGTTFRLLIDGPAIDRLAGAGVLSFETIYARSA